MKLIIISDVLISFEKMLYLINHNDGRNDEIGRDDRQYKLRDKHHYEKNQSLPERDLHFQDRCDAPEYYGHQYHYDLLDFLPRIYL